MQSLFALGTHAARALTHRLMGGRTTPCKIGIGAALDLPQLALSKGVAEEIQNTIASGKEVTVRISWIFGTAFPCETRNEDQSGFARQLAVPYQQEEIIMPTVPTTARLEARISPEVHALLKCAAELQGRTLTDFVVSAAQDAARLAIEQAKTIRLSLADQERFAHALLAPPEPAPALQRAFARRRQLLAAE